MKLEEIINTIQLGNAYEMLKRVKMNKLLKILLRFTHYYHDRKVFKK